MKLCELYDLMCGWSDSSYAGVRAPDVEGVICSFITRSGVRNTQCLSDVIRGGDRSILRSETEIVPLIEIRIGHPPMGFKCEILLSIMVGLMTHEEWRDATVVLNERESGWSLFEMKNKI